MSEPERNDEETLEALIAEKAAEGKDSGWAVAWVLMKSLKAQKEMIAGLAGIDRAIAPNSLNHSVTEKLDRIVGVIEQVLRTIRKLNGEDPYHNL